MFDLKLVAIAIRFLSGVAHAAFEQIPIAEAKLSDVKARRYRQRKTVLPDLPSRDRLHRDIQETRRDAEVLGKAKSKPDSDAFIDGTMKVATEPQRAEQVEVDRPGYGNGELDVGPLLVIRVIYLARNLSHR